MPAEHQKISNNIMGLLDDKEEALGLIYVHSIFKRTLRILSCAWFGHGRLIVATEWSSYIHLDIINSSWVKLSKSINSLVHQSVANIH